MILVVWAVENTALIRIIQGLSLFGFAIALVATFLISHPDLFGLRQVVLHLRGKQAAATGFVTPGLYKFVRHPIYLGFTLAFWAAPVMTTGRLLFAGGTLAYILLAIRLEERDLVRDHGDDSSSTAAASACCFRSGAAAETRYGGGRRRLPLEG